MRIGKCCAFCNMFYLLFFFSPRATDCNTSLVRRRCATVYEWLWQSYRPWPTIRPADYVARVSTELNKLVSSVQSAYISFRPGFVRVSLLVYSIGGYADMRAAARVTSGACTRSCNPWKIINTRSLRLLSFFSLSPFDSRCQRSARAFGPFGA